MSNGNITIVLKGEDLRNGDIHRGANFALILAVCTIMSENKDLCQRVMHALQKTVEGLSQSGKMDAFGLGFQTCYQEMADRLSEIVPGVQPPKPAD